MIQSVINFLAGLTLLSDIFIVILIIYLLLRQVRKIIFLESLLDIFTRYAIILAFIVALTATGGSLFFSQVAGIVPCELCWFQRIFIYPQVIILGLALYFKDPAARKYAIVLGLIGGTISLYNYFIQLFPPAVSVCSINAADSCSQTIIMAYGYITFAVMALTASILIIILMALSIKLPAEKKNVKNETE